ncbi:MAG: DVU_1556 family methyltransferase [Desulfobacterales bacterium]
MNRTTPCPSLFESGELRSVTGPAIRPGGLSLTERALKFCAIRPGERVLDAGCGEGATIAHLRNVRGLAGVGLDPSAFLLSSGKCRDPEIPFVRGKAEALPFADHSFAGILCECVLSLVQDPAAALGEFFRILGPKGHLVVSDVYSRYATPPSDPPVRSCLGGAATVEVIQRRITDAGFSILLWEDHTPALKYLAARLVFAHGSLAGFWKKTGGECTAGGKPGYFLLVGRKTDG